VRGVELLQVALDRCGGPGLLGRWTGSYSDGCEDVAGLEVVQSQGRGFAVAASYFVDDGDCARVVAFTHEELGRLVDGEAHKAQEKHDQRCAALLMVSKYADPTISSSTHHDNQEVPPPHILTPRALLIRLLTRQIPQ
jgi:hypothetical protein